MNPSNAFSRESAVVFGTYENLVGVLRHPVRPTAPEDVAVLILTPGMLHSAGPFRLHVELAETLGECGLRSLRFDLSGIGESLAIGSTSDSLTRAASEISQAIDFLSEHYQVQRVLLFGLCSGADDAIHAARLDERIAGVFAMDGCGYRTLRYFGHRIWSNYLPKLFNGKKWLNVAKQLVGVQEDAPESLQLGDDIREFPEQAEACRQLQELVARSVQLHFHYTGGVAEYYNYADQFADMFPSLAMHPLVSTSFAPESDHVAFLCEHRTALVRLASQTLARFASKLPEADSKPASAPAVFPTLDAGLVSVGPGVGVPGN